MPWCPKCKNEYVAGVKVCVDCGCELVSTLEEECMQPVMFGTLEELKPMEAFLKANKVLSAELRQAEEESIYELFASGKDKPAAEHALRVYQEEARKELEKAQKEMSLPKGRISPEFPPKDGEDGTEAPGQPPVSKGPAVYQKSSEKAEDFKSSAYVLILVGSVGIAVLALLLAGVLPIQVSGMNRYLISGVMGAMFVLFIVMGVLSLRSSRALLGKAAKEDELTKEIMNWCGRNLTCDAIDQELFLTDQEMDELTEEEKYFKRTAYMKTRINSQFMNLDESYLDQLIDDYYQEIFG